MGFSRQKYWSGLPFPPPGDFPDPGIKSASPALAGRFFFFFFNVVIFFKFYFIFKLYIIVLVLPNIKMNLPREHMYTCGGQILYHWAT